MSLPAVTEKPLLEGTDPWPSAEDALSAALVVAGIAQDVYGDRLLEVWMYGSRARGEWQPESDLDLLMVLADEDSPRHWRWRALPELRGKLIERYQYLTQSMISLYAALPEQMRSWDTMFFRSVRRHAIRVL